MNKVTLIIKNLRNNAYEIISGVPENQTTRIVEKWQRSTAYAQVHKRPNPCAWKVATQNGLLNAMLETPNL